MSLTTFRNSRLIKATVPLALASLLATLLPSRSSKADDSAPASQGAHGSLAAPGAASPTINQTEALANVDVSMGSVSTEYAFKLPKARGDAQPSLALRYNSQSGVGFAGIGWSLNLPAITRRGRSGIPRFIDAVLTSPTTLSTDLNTDDYYIDDKLLIPIDPSTEVFPSNLPSFSVSGPGDHRFVEAWAVFRTEVDDGSRYFFPSGMLGQTWVVQTKSGHMLQFGDPLDHSGPPSLDQADNATASTLSHIDQVGVTNLTYRWNLVRDTDSIGNSVVYHWDRQSELFTPGLQSFLPSGLNYLTDIYDTSSQAPNADLTANPPATGTFAHHVHLTWTLAAYPNGDPFGGFPIPHANSAIWRAIPHAQLSAVDVTSDTMNSTGRQLVRRYQLSYSYNSTQTRAYLTAIQPIGDCESHGGPIVESATIGAIGTDSATQFRLLTCTGAETMPPTTYSYTGITNAGTSPPPTAFPSPRIVARTPAYGSPLTPDFAVDLDGDGADELVAGTNGNPASACLTCALSTAGTVLDNATGGAWLLFGGNDVSCHANNQTCYKPGQITGPDQTDGTTFSITQAAGLATVKADDAMFTEAVVGDWAPTGRKSFLQIWPTKLPVPIGTYFSNPHTELVALGQFSGAMSSSASTTYQSLFNQAFLPNADSEFIQAQLGASEPVTPVPGLAPQNFSAGRGVDLDGDGLPDMALVPIVANAQISGYTSFFTSRDRAGTTHPFGQIGTNFCPAPSGLGSAYPIPSDSTEYAAFTDIDGDGLADLVYFSKFGPNFATTGAHKYLNFHVLVNRGDGRFGLPVSYPSNTIPPCYQTYNASVTPTDVASPQASDPVGPETVQGSVIRFGDLNGDGMADYADLDSGGLHICLRYGASWDNAAYRCVTDTIEAGNDQTSTAVTHPTIMIADIDGSGVNQVVYFPAPRAPGGAPSGNAIAVRVAPDNTIAQLGGGPIDGLLQSVSNGAGAVTTFSYQSIHELNRELGIGAIPVPVWVVTQTQTTNSLILGGAVTTKTNYTYNKPVYDNRERRFVGFQNAQALTQGDVAGGSNGRLIKTTFATNACIPTTGIGIVQNNGCNDPTSTGYYSIYHALRGLPVAVETDEILPNGATGTLGTPFTTVINSYAFQTPYTGLDGRTGISLKSSTKRTYLWGAAPPAGTPVIWTISRDTALPPAGSGPVTVPSGVTPMAEVTTYDVNGNRLSVVENGGTSTSTTDIPITHSWTWQRPIGDGTGWNFRVMKEVTGYASGPGPSREIDYGYDALGRLTQITRIIADTATLLGPGGAARVALPPGQSSNGEQTVNLGYEPYGNVSTVSTAQSACLQSFTFAPPYYELKATTTTSSTGNCISGLLTTSYSYDRGLQLVTSAIDPANRVTLEKYDDFGRVLEVDKPSQGAPMGTIAALYVKSYSDSGPIRTVHFQSASGDEGTAGATTAPAYVDHYVYTDGFGDVLANVDAVDPASHQGNAWILSGVHSRYTDGRVHATFRPMYMIGAGPVLGTLPAQTIFPTSPSATRAYDGLGRIVSGTDYNGNAFKKVYGGFSVDSYDQEETCALPASRCAELPSVPPHLGHETYTWDGHGRLVEDDKHLSVGPDGTSGTLSTTVTYQATGEPLQIQQVVPNSPTVIRSMTYDSQGRMVQNSEPNAGTWTYAYDDMDQLVGTSDARGCGMNIGRDAAERAVYADYIPCPSAIGASQQADHSVPQANGDGTEQFYVYNSLGQLTDAYDLARHDSYVYWPGGLTRTWTTQLAIPGGSTSLDARYAAPADTNTFQKLYASYTVDGAPTRVSTGTPSTFAPLHSFLEGTTYTLDQRIASTSLSADWSGNIISSMSYFADGTPQGATFGDAAGTNAQMVFNGNGELSFYHLTRGAGAYANGAFTSTVSPQPPDSTTTQADLTTLWITPDLVGNPKTVIDLSIGAWPSGAGQVSQTYTYSDDYRLASVTTNSLPDLWSSPYQWDPPGTYPAVSAPSTALRLRTQSFRYDWRGNMTSSVDDAKDFPDRSLGTTVRVGGPDQFGQVNLANGISAEAAYDGTGNLYSFNPSWNNQSTSEGYSYRWNELGQLAEAQRTDSDGLVHVKETYVYDRSGHRVITARTDPTKGQTNYTVNVFDTLVLENAQYPGAQGGYQDDEITANFYLSGGMVHAFSRPGLPVSTTTNAGTTGVHWFLNLPDPRGSTAFVIDYETGEVVERSAHQAYGAIDTDDRPKRWGHFREDVKFTGQWDNTEVGLVYMGARYYSPQLGRFISPDPAAIHNPRASNPYEYGNSSPMRFTDPSGLAPEDSSWDQLSLEDQAANLAGYAAAERGDWDPASPDETVTNASDAPGGVASDFDTGGALSDYNGLPFNWDKLGSDAASYTAGVGTEVWNSSLSAMAAVNPPMALLWGVTGTSPLNMLRLPQPSTQMGQMGAQAAMVAGLFIAPEGEAEVLAADGALGSSRAYSVAFQTTLEEVGAGTRAAHFKAANTALSELSTETLQELGITVPKSNAGTILGESPSGWTWHHVPDQPGVMQLVPRAMHQGSPWQPLFHPGGVGGFKLWGVDF